MSALTRRQFIKGAAAGAAGLALLGDGAFARDSDAMMKRPNILFIHADQLHFEAISSLGCKHVHTPNLDRLLDRGVAFTSAYSANPVCCPARAAWYTGRASSENGMLSNAHKLNPDLPDLGQWFKTRGYEPFYSGKWHVPGRNPRDSFNVLTADLTGQGEHGDAVVSRTAQAFLGSYSGDKPFFLSLGFLQPHDCCYWVFAHEEDIAECPYPSIENDLPPLPENFHYDVEEAEALSKFMGRIRGLTRKWSPLLWRYYIWSYYRHVEMVDAELGRTLDALDDSRFADNTLIVFMADHGDCLGRRQMVQKWTPYDEAARVPMIVVPPGATSDGRKDTAHVVSGLDLAPTLCDYAGIDAPPKHRGTSLRPAVEGKGGEWREFVVSEVNITGRVLRTPEYKLVTYRGDPVVQLFDMRKDPWETKNLAGEVRYADVVRDLTKRLGEWESELEVTEP